VSTFWSWGGSADEPRPLSAVAQRRPARPGRLDERRKSSIGIGRSSWSCSRPRSRSRSADSEAGMRSVRSRACAPPVPASRGLELALGVDHLGPPLPLGLGLARHRPLHTLGRSKSFTSTAETSIPRVGASSMMRLRIPLIFSRSARARRAPPRPAPSGGWSARADSWRRVVLDLDDGLGRVHHAHVEDCVHLERDVVAGDDVRG